MEKVFLGKLWQIKLIFNELEKPLGSKNTSFFLEKFFEKLEVDYDNYGKGFLMKNTFTKLFGKVEFVFVDRENR